MTEHVLISVSSTTSHKGGGGVVVAVGAVVAEEMRRGGKKRRPNFCVSEGSKKRKIKFKKRWVLHKYTHTSISVNCPCVCSTA